LPLQSGDEIQLPTPIEKRCATGIDTVLEERTSKGKAELPDNDEHRLVQAPCPTPLVPSNPIPAPQTPSEGKGKTGAADSESTILTPAPISRRHSAKGRSAFADRPAQATSAVGLSEPAPTASITGASAQNIRPEIPPPALADEFLDCLYIAEQHRTDGRCDALIDYKRLDHVQHAGNMKTYLVGSVIDPFDPRVSLEIADELFAVIFKTQESQFRIETSHLDRVLEYAKLVRSRGTLSRLPINMSLGISLRCPKDLVLLDSFAQIEHEVKYVSFAEYRSDPSCPLVIGDLLPCLSKCELREIVLGSELLSDSDAKCLDAVAGAADMGCWIVDLRN
jgi:hypothetical protein